VSGGSWACIGVLIAFGGFWAIGRLVPDREPWESPLLGWSVSYLISVLAVLCGAANLKVGLVVCLALIVFSITRRRTTVQPGGAWIYLIFGAAILILALFIPPLFIDSYMHWLLNAAYLFQLDSYPQAPLENFPSRHPTYPGAFPLAIYVASVVTGRFAEMAGSVTNAMSTLVATACIAQFLRENCASPLIGSRAASISRYGIPALAFCIVLPLNPAIQLEYYWSAIADPALAAVVLVVVVQWCRFMTHEEFDLAHEDLRNDWRSPSVSRAGSALLSLFLLSSLIGGLKTSGWVVAFVLSAAGALVAVIHRVPARRWISGGIAISSGAWLSCSIWNAYLAYRLPIPDEVSVLPIGEWRFDLLGSFLMSVRADALGHWQYYGLVFATCVAGFLSLIKRSLIASPNARLLLGVVSVAMSLHVLSLVATYIGVSFLDWEISQALSFQRYSAHLGFSVCVVGIAVLVLEALPYAAGFLRRARAKYVVACATAACGALFFVQVVRPSLSVAADLRGSLEKTVPSLTALKLIPAGHRAVVVGDFWSLYLIQYVLWTEIALPDRPILVAKQEVNRRKDVPAAEQELERWIADPSIDAILLVDALEFAVQVGLEPAPDYLWSRSTERWQKLDIERASPFRLSADD